MAPSGPANTLATSSILLPYGSPQTGSSSFRDPSNGSEWYSRDVAIVPRRMHTGHRLGVEGTVRHQERVRERSREPRGRRELPSSRSRISGG